MTCFEDLWVGRKDANKNVQTSNVLKQWSTATKFFWEKWVSCHHPLLYIDLYQNLCWSWRIMKYPSIITTRAENILEAWVVWAIFVNGILGSTYEANDMEIQPSEAVDRVASLWSTVVSYFVIGWYRLSGHELLPETIFWSPHEDRYASETFGPLAAGKSNVIFKFLGLTSRFDTTISGISHIDFVSREILCHGHHGIHAAAYLWLPKDRFKISKKNSWPGNRVSGTSTLKGGGNQAPAAGQADISNLWKSEASNPLNPKTYC